MLIAPDDGKPMMVAAGREIRLAQADIFKEEGKPEEGKPAETGKPDETGKPGETAAGKGMSTTAKVIVGALAIGGIAAALGGGGGGGSDEPPPPPPPPPPASPSAP